MYMPEVYKSQPSLTVVNKTISTSQNTDANHELQIYTFQEKAVTIVLIVLQICYLSSLQQ